MLDERATVVTGKCANFILNFCDTRAATDVHSLLYVDIKAYMKYIFAREIFYNTCFWKKQFYIVNILSPLNKTLNVFSTTEILIKENFVPGMFQKKYLYFKISVKLE